MKQMNIILPFYQRPLADSLFASISQGPPIYQLQPSSKNRPKNQ